MDASAAFHGPVAVNTGWIKLAHLSDQERNKDKEKDADKDKDKDKNKDKDKDKEKAKAKEKDTEKDKDKDAMEQQKGERRLVLSPFAQHAVGQSPWRCAHSKVFVR